MSRSPEATDVLDVEREPLTAADDPAGNDGKRSAPTNNKLAKQMGLACLCCCLGLPLLLLLLLLFFAAVGEKPPVPSDGLLSALLEPYRTMPDVYPAKTLRSEAFQDKASSFPPNAEPYNMCAEPNKDVARINNNSGDIFPGRRLSQKPSLPDPSELFDKLLARKEFVPERFGFNLLHCTFVNFFLEDFFRTVRGTEGSWQDKGTVWLSQVYGTTDARIEALRSHENGKMKVGEDGRLPHWADVVKDHPSLSLRCHHLPGYSHQEACLENSTKWYACGDERCNTHPGFIAWSTIFTLHHNFVCGMMHDAYPEMTDEELFQAARYVNWHTMFKIVWEEYVFRMVCKKDLCRIPFEPEKVREMGFAEFKPEQHHHAMSFEFNQLYQWHQWIPDYILWDDEGKDKTKFTDMMWDPDLFKSKSLSTWMEAFHRTPMGHIQAQNYPLFMKPSFVKFLNFARQNGLPSYNTYRPIYHLPKYTSFEEFELSPELTSELKRLYNNDVDSVEFQVGLFVDAQEDPKLKSLGLVSPLSLAMKRMVGAHALNNVRNKPGVADPKIFTAEAMTEKGLRYAKSVTLETMLENVGIKGLGPTPNELPDSWRPFGFKTAMIRGIVGLAKLFT